MRWFASWRPTRRCSESRRCSPRRYSRGADASPTTSVALDTREETDDEPTSGESAEIATGETPPAQRDSSREPRHHPGPIQGPVPMMGVTARDRLLAEFRDRLAGARLNLARSVAITDADL